MSEFNALVCTLYAERYMQWCERG